MTGRFAPTPTGPLHFGSLVTAIASYLDARSQRGKWLVRIEDIDTSRVVPGADADILRTLERFGFEWDGPVLYQSTRTDAYRDALERLRENGFVYPCSCSRTTTEPCSCASGEFMAGSRWRVHFSNDNFTVRRADGIFSYHLAVVVDDAFQQVTDVVRGADLLESTPRHIHLQKLLGLPTPRYNHVPVVTNQRGEKLSKQTLAPPVDTNAAPALLAQALLFLGHDVPPNAGHTDLSALWMWALANWQARLAGFVSSTHHCGPS